MNVPTFLTQDSATGAHNLAQGSLHDLSPRGCAGHSQNHPGLQDTGLWETRAPNIDSVAMGEKWGTEGERRQPV